MVSTKRVQAMKVEFRYLLPNTLRSSFSQVVLWSETDDPYH